MIRGKYISSGMQGLIKDGGSSRVEQARKNIANLGGKVEAVYFALGDYDIYAILEFKDNISITALSMALNAGGGMETSTTVLLSPEEIDEATKKTSWT